MKLIYDVTLHDYIHLCTLWRYVCELNVYNSEKRATFFILLTWGDFILLWLLLSQAKGNFMI